MRVRIAAAVLVLLFLATSAGPSLGAPALGVPENGPDVPTASTPVARVVVLQDEVWSFTAGFRGRDIEVPSVPWNRVVLVHEQDQVGDPWDRLFAASIAGVEVLRGTTPRIDFVVKKDVTRYASLLPPGGVVRVEGYTDSWVGGTSMVITLTLEFYHDATAALVEAPADNVVGVTRFSGLCIGSAPTFTRTFPAEAPSSAVAEFFLSGHGNEEFWFLDPIPRVRVFHLDVDGTEVATVYALPYTYAFLGFGNADGSMGPTHEAVHGVMWWTAQQGLDHAGVHGGVGEIPPYRAQIDAEHLGLLTGTRQLTLRLDTVPTPDQGCAWVSSAGMLLGA